MSGIELGDYSVRLLYVGLGNILLALFCSYFACLRRMDDDVT